MEMQGLHQQLLDLAFCDDNMSDTLLL